MALLTGVFDESAVPENQPFPYLTLGGVIETQADTMGTVNARGYDDIYTINGWSQTRGYQQLQTMLGRMNAALLPRKTLILPGQAHVGTWYVNALFLEDPDGITQHLVARYRIFSQENL